jgi:spermidine synthase
MVACFLLLALAALPAGQALHWATLRWQWPGLVYAADSVYGRLTVQANEGQRAFFQDGRLAFETQGTLAEEVVHFPLLAHPNPQRILLIGGGVAGDLREMLKHPTVDVTYVELDPLLIRAAQGHLPAQDGATLRDPRVSLVLADGRQYVMRCTQLADGEGVGKAPCRFDVVVLDLPEPSTGTLNRFYTREFFAEVRAVLNPGGILALGLPSAENYWSPELARRNASVYHTLRAVFSETLALSGEHSYFLASDTAIESDPGVLAQRLAERGIRTRQVTASYIRYVLTTDRFAQGEQELLDYRGVRLNTDLAPICYYYDLALWLSRFYPHLRGAYESASLAKLWWIIAPLLLVAALARWRRRWAVPTAVALMGLAQMALEVTILLSFQVLYGYVYAQVSVLVTAAMLGLALGGAAGNRVLGRGRVHAERGRTAKRVLLILQLAIAGCSGILLAALSLPVPHLLVPATVAALPFLALVSAFITGMAFPLALALVPESPGGAAGMLYGADLLGGCLGAVLGAVLMIPLLGIPQTCLFVVLVGLAGLLALL